MYSSGAPELAPGSQRGSCCWYTGLLVEQQLRTLLEHLSWPPVLSGVRVAGTRVTSGAATAYSSGAPELAPGS